MIKKGLMSLMISGQLRKACDSLRVNYLPFFRSKIENLENQENFCQVLHFFRLYIDRAAAAVLYNSVQTLYWLEQLLPRAFKRSAKKTRRKTIKRERFFPRKQRNKPQER